MNPTLLPKHMARRVVVKDGCWEWTGPLGLSGYGRASFRGKTHLVHRISYESLVGPIPAGLVIDHLCRVRHCVNPAHLRACTVGENLHAPGSLAIAAANAAKTHCAHGHPLSGENLVIDRSRRACRECRLIKNRRWRERKKVSA